MYEIYKRKTSIIQTKRDLIFILDELIYHFPQNRKKLVQSLISWYTLR